MITPRFRLSQTPESVTIIVRAPYCSLRDLNVVINGSEFTFVCKPYNLKLSLPGNIQDDERKHTSFDSDSGEFSLTYAKETEGQHFDRLDLMTRFLVPTEDINYSEGSIPIEELDGDEDTEPLCENLPSTADTTYGFGFGLRANKHFVRINVHFEDLFELDPSLIPVPERRQLRITNEQNKFDSDHYLADYQANNEILQIISLQSPFMIEAKYKKNFAFTAREMDFLKNLPNVRYDLSQECLNYCFNGLIDILYAFCFNYRVTYFEGSSEAAWDICKLASTLSWLDVFRNPKDVMITAFRRSLIFPYFRNFNLAQAVFEDLKVLIQLGEIYIVRALIQVYDIFLHGDCGRYILNNLFIKDYITFVLKCNQDQWKSVVSDLLKVKLQKRDLGLELDEYEEGYKFLQHLESMNIGFDSDDSDDIVTNDYTY